MGYLDLFPVKNKIEEQHLMADPFRTRGAADGDPFRTTPHNRSQSPAVRDAPELENSVFGKYQILQLIASGTMGRVYRAFDTTARTTVALKLIREDRSPKSKDKTRNFFKREVAVLQRLDHPRIVQIHDFGNVDGYLYIAMDYVETFDLRKELAACSTSQQIRLVCGIGCYMLSGLAHAHALNIVHRDIKPQNLLVYRSPENKIGIKLADFGISKDLRDSGMNGMTREGEMRGTPAFMSQEQLHNSRDAGPASDIYSTAAVLYYFLTGMVPHQKDVRTPITVAQIIESSPLPIALRRSDLPTQLCDVIDRGLAPISSGRYATAIEFNQALIEFTRKGKGW